MTTRTIEQIETASVEWVGPNKVLRALPTRNLKQVDPFLFIDHLQPQTLVPGGQAMRIAPHPHAGFEVVTYLLDGAFFHRDSKGHEQVAHAGDLNWMTAGSGVIHSEGPTAAYVESGGPLQLMQVWINLPAAEKFRPASFVHYQSSQLPVWNGPDGWVKVLIGSFQGLHSPVSTHTSMFYYHIRIAAGQRITLPVPPDHTAALYVMAGKIRILQQIASSGQLVNSSMNGDQLIFTGEEDSELIAFGGLPIGEKVVSYGPFVMNSMAEIQQVMADYESGKMGTLAY